MILTRYCPRGRMYSLVGIPEQPLTHVYLNGKCMEFPMEINAIDRAWFNWTIDGQTIQAAFPELHTNYREFLVSGLLPEQFDSLEGV